MISRPFETHLDSDDGLVTPYEATRAGFVALALEKNRLASPYVDQARNLQHAALAAKTPSDLPKVKGIESGLLTAAGLSDKALTHLQGEDRAKAISNLIENYLEPAGAKFIEELVFRFLLTKGDSLGGSMRNIGGALAQRKLTRAMLSTLTLAGIAYQWQDSRTKKWIAQSTDDSDIEFALRGLSWEGADGIRTLIFNLNVPFIGNNVDLCVFNIEPHSVETSKYSLPDSYVALGELKGGIDPAGADEHWKTARSALMRIRDRFTELNYNPFLFFIGASIEKRMAREIWEQLQNGDLSNAANLNDDNQVVSISRWLCSV